MKKVLFVANHWAGGDTSVVERASHLGVELGYEVSTATTETRGHGVLLASDAAEQGFDVVIAVGGDGTAREVAAGLSGTETAFGIVPAGTGNSSYRELFADAPWEAAMRQGLESGATRQVDLLQVQPTGEISLLGFSVGWFAQVIELAKAESEHSGRERYMAAAQSAAAAPRSFEARVELDGQPFASGELALIAAGGARVRGGVFPVLPDSSIDDGLLDVVALPKTEPEDFLALMGLVLRGEHRDSPLLTFGRGHRLAITGGLPLPAEIDGDLWERDVAACEVVVAVGALRVLTG